MKVFGPRAPQPIAAAPAAELRAPSAQVAPPDSFATPIKEIALAGSITDPETQISSMAWHGDRLLLLPEKGGRLYALDKSDVLKAVDGATGPLTPHRLLLVPPRFNDRMPGFDGFEAMAVVGDRVYLLAEAKSETESWGYLMSGRILGRGVIVDLDSVKRLPPSSPVRNKGYEALVVAGDRIIALPEAQSGPHVAHAFSLDLEPLGEVSMPHVDYRLTDSTPADADGRFWVANYNLPGEPNMPEGPRVEQLLPMRVEGQAVVPDGPPQPIALDWSQGGRNWEALERLDDRGFLVMTDMFPRAILGFVPR